MKMFLPAVQLFMPLLILFVLPLSLPVRSLSFRIGIAAMATEKEYCYRGAEAICIGGNGSLGNLDYYIHLTPCGYDMSAWAYYTEPLQLWDSNSTGKAASFNTSFSMDILRCENDSFGSGAAFFLSSYPYQPPSQAPLRPDLLGLVNTQGFVAIEFDTVKSISTDPEAPHMGIDVNSVDSVETASLKGTRGNISGTAVVRYDANTEILSVTYSDFINKSHVVSLNYSVSLRDVLPEWVVVGFSGVSANDAMELSDITAWEFTSTMDHVTIQHRQSNTSAALNRTSEAPSPDTHPNNRTSEAPSSEMHPNTTDAEPAVVSENRNHSRVGLLVGLTTGVGLIIAVASSVLFCMWRSGGLLIKKKNEDSSVREANSEHKSTAEMVNKDGNSIDKLIERGNEPRRFSYSELATATAYFSENKKLGAGGFGSVYRGFLCDLAIDVAIKKFSGDATQGTKQYISEVKIINQLRHKNLIRLVGWCHEGNDLLLVYELMPNGSLDYHLFGMNMPILSWMLRYKIALGLASALSYLHTGWERCVIHRDVKSSNIMLDSNFEVKLGDFGLARVVDRRSRIETTIVAGTPGYIAPEYVFSGKYCQETDVYSFGVVLLEIVSGRAATDTVLKDGNCRLVDWAWSMYKSGRLIEVADPKLEGEFDSNELERLTMVGLWCANLVPTARPSMQKAIAALNFDITLMPKLSPESASTSIFVTENMKPSSSITSRSSPTENSTWSASYNTTVSFNTSY